MQEAIVTDTSPLTVRRFGETIELTVEKNYAGTLVVDDEVLVDTLNGRLIIISGPLV